MSANPLLSASTGREPYLDTTCESLLHVSAKAEFIVESGGGYPGAGGSFYSRSGRIFLTGTRVVFVTDNSSGGDGFDAFELPLLKLRSAKLEKRFIMKRRAISGRVEPTANGGLVGVGSYKLTLQDGTAKDFFHTLINAIMFIIQHGASRHELDAARKEPNPIEQQAPVLQAYIDPNDPFSIFVTGPTP